MSTIFDLKDLKEHIKLTKKKVGVIVTQSSGNQRNLSDDVYSDLEKYIINLNRIILNLENEVKIKKELAKNPRKFVHN